MYQHLTECKARAENMQISFCFCETCICLKVLARRRTYVTSRDFNDRVHVLFLEILCDSGKTLFDISVNTGQICMRFEADTPQKLLKYAHLTKFPDKKLI